MFYLLSDTQKKKVKREYYVKVTRLAIISLVVVFIMTICLSVPTAIRIYTEVTKLNATIEPLENQISIMKNQVSKEDVSKIVADVDILSMPPKVDISKIYVRFIEVVESVPGAKIQTMSVDTIGKTIKTSLSVRDKDVAEVLIRKITEEKYGGADLPYNILSQKASFVFSQSLTYENI